MNESDIKQVWFDFAGTLYKETHTFNVVHDQLRYSTFAKVMGISDIKIAEREFLEAYKEHGSNSAVFRALGKSPDYWSKALDDMDFSKVLSPDPEVTNSLKELKEKVPISLFTNFIKPRVNELLGYLVIPPSYFIHMITGDEIINRKPALDGFYRMIDKSGLPPENILYVGDRIDVDIKPAKTLGIKTCLIYGESDIADYSITSFKELLLLISSV
jgi:putative hydrolase of the HAD superfamily